MANKTNNVVKGYDNELALAKKLTAFFGGEFCRSDGSGKRRFKNFNKQAFGDVFQNDNKCRFPFIIETKHYDQKNPKYIVGDFFKRGHVIYTIFMKLQEEVARAEAGGSGFIAPLLFFRANLANGRQDWLIIMTEHFWQYLNSIVKVPMYSESLDTSCPTKLYVTKFSDIVKIGDKAKIAFFTYGLPPEED